MTDELILTFDLGTTRLKVALFDLAGRLVAQVSRRNVDCHEAGAHWQSADRWWQDCIDCTQQLVREQHIDTSAVKGISLSGRASAAIFVDATGKVICDPWSDTRHNEVLKALLRGRNRDDVAMYGATLLAKAQYLQIESPDVFEKVRHLLYAKDFLLFRLTGECVTDPSSGPDGQWDSELVRESNIPSAMLPTPKMPWQLAGEVSATAARSLGLHAGTPVAVGAHDGICANTGAGSAFPGQYAITLGTHAVVRAITEVRPKGALRFYGYPPDRHVIG
ncbi:MAG TPA: FGGY-family carbohydrate kinase, partial [Pseudomonadales bacterium]|nr:FGGY-family carbohydrate kinase [Pseudomonadales bacterium]